MNLELNQKQAELEISTSCSPKVGNLNLKPVNFFWKP